MSVASTGDSLSLRDSASTVYRRNKDVHSIVSKHNMECHLQVISSNLQGGAFLFRFAGRARSSGVGAGRFSRTTAFQNRLPHSTQMESPTPCALSLSTTASSGTSCLWPS